jgi:hypothetical protein
VKRRPLYLVDEELGGEDEDPEENVDRADRDDRADRNDRDGEDVFDLRSPHRDRGNPPDAP